MGTLNLFNIFRARLFNIKLFGDTRLGIYKEISIEDVKLFITDFHNFCKSNETVNEESEIRTNLPDSNNFQILKRLCEQYYVYENTDKFQLKIIQEVKEIVNEFRNDQQTQKDLEQWLNATQNNAVGKIRLSHPELKEEEIKLFCYIQAGFTPTMMSVLLQKDKSVVYNRVSRLKAKIKE